MKNFQDLSPVDYLRILRRRIWYFIIPAVLVSAGACYFAWRQAPFYKSEMTIQVANRLLPDDYIGSLVRESPTDRIEFVRQQIRSRTFVLRLVEDLQLANGQTNTDEIVSYVGSSITFDVYPPNSFKLGFHDTDPAQAQSVVKRLGERVMQLNDNFRKETILVADQFLDEEVRRASNDLAQAEEKLRLFSEQNFRGLPAQVDTLSLASLQNQLAAAEADLADSIQFRDTTRRRLQEQNQLQLAGRTPAPPPRRDPAVTQAPKPAPPPPSPHEPTLTAKRAQLARLGPDHPDRPRMRREVADLERLVAEYNEAQARAAAAPPPPEPVTPQIPQADPALPNLPELDATVEFMEAEIKFELEKLNRTIAAKERTKQDLARQVAQLTRRLNLPPALAQELSSLSEDVQNARDRYNLFSNKKLSSELAEKVDTNPNNKTFRIFDDANLPMTPSGPNRQRNAAAGSLAGIILGLGLVFLREILDTTLRNEDEASAQLKLPILTSVPVVAGPPKKRFKRFRRSQSDSMEDISLMAAPLRADFLDSELEPATTFGLASVDSRVRSVILDYRTIAGEQYRLMRATLSLMRRKQEKLKTILIASTIPNEGKTFAACSLAAVLAQEPGKKVLLIDADFRTSSASAMLGLNGNTPRTGLSQVLRGEAQIEQSVAACNELNLCFLPTGGPVSDPTELLATPALEEMIRRCEELFDWIIIDSPPILALADANILLPVCDTALLVVRAGKTPLKLIKDSVSRMGGDRICGVLMNGVSDIGPTGYYGHYYNTSAGKPL